MSIDAVPPAPLDIAAFYELVTRHLEAEFGRRRPFWIRGEILKVYEKGHMYIDLVDAGSSSDTRRPVLGAHIWTSQWAPIKKALAEAGLTLKEGMMVNVFGYCDVYAPQGRIGFSVTEIDTSGLLGDVAKKRQEIIARLRESGAMAAQQALTRPLVPLRIGLVASPQTEGFNDFTGQLIHSRYSFKIGLVATLVQGEQAPAQIMAALRYLDALDYDVICVVRGGGSKMDLACFDDEALAMTIAAMTTPVWTGIGHTGDEAIADLVANHHAITPTKLGEELVNLVDGWTDAHVRQPAQHLLLKSAAVLEEATAYVGERRRTMVLTVRDRLRSERRHLTTVRERLALHAHHVLTTSARQLATTRQLLAAYDPSRRLRQGWSILTNAKGEVLRATSEVAVGESIVIQMSDGHLGAVVTERKES